MTPVGPICPVGPVKPVGPVEPVYPVEPDEYTIQLAGLVEGINPVATGAMAMYDEVA